MTDVQRIYRRSEKRLIPRRLCPDCRAPVRGHWKEHPGMTAEFDPQGDVTWHCLGERCFTGREGF
ncbi:hypothetical protein GCM10010307_09420 [Streptomyces vastus]|uniref:Uncharacterized protein n=1 Tax=Streptomyces vastus TaxID=285451 RepID=A0ABP6CM64_9ACTN